MRLSKKTAKIWAIAFAAMHLYELIFPSVSLALTGGPGAPEFSSFEPIATTDMVNVFNGGFTYNLPVIQVPDPDGRGYSMSLSYHSGTTSEEEASWVGYGWTLNPGAINRGVRGYPDEFRAAPVTTWNKTRPNWTLSAMADVQFEGFSVDQSKIPVLESLALAASIRYNNYKGLYKSFGLTLDMKGLPPLAFKKSSTGISFMPAINFKQLLTSKFKKKSEGTDPDEEKGQQECMPTTDEVMNELKDAKPTFNTARLKPAAMGRSIAQGNLSQFSSAYGIYSLGTFAQPMSITDYTGIGFNISASIQGNPPPVPTGIELGFSGGFNIQMNKREADQKAFGYMFNPEIDDYDGGTWDPEAIQSDYIVEKDGNFDNKDYFLGIPFNTADNFNVTGEGIMGGFRMYHNKIGHHYPNHTSNHFATFNAAIEFGAGADIELGFDFGAGLQSTVSKDWDAPLSSNAVSGPDDLQFDLYDPSTDWADGQFDEDIPAFRYNGDLGGKVEYSTSTELKTAIIPQLPLPLSAPGLKNYEADVSTLGLKSGFYSSNKEIKRSSFVEFDMYNAAGSGSQFGANLDQLPSTTALRGSGESPAHGIFELATTSEAGERFVYGLPVYVKDESNFSFEIDPDDHVIVDNYLAYRDDAHTSGDIKKDNKVVIGQRKDIAYANSYLLTQILSPDYVDADLNGYPNDGDFGGWTTFKYDRAHTEYDFRAPFTGLSYQQGTISSHEDDMGSVSMGQKDVCYLQEVETKSHKALFITNESVAADFFTSGELAQLPQTIVQHLDGSGTDRYDGMSAKGPGSQDDAIKEAAATNKAAGTKKLRYLEKIILISKGDNPQLEQVVNFEYDYHLVRNLPNSQYGEYPNNATSTANYEKSGKLTLKRVWFEYNGVVNAKIAPYEFKYHYKKSSEFPSKITSATGYDYQDILNDYDALDVDNDQNPDYLPQGLDAWGNYQYGGALRHALMKPWVSQEPASSHFDPAAWQLKQVILPSGGEIHVHYEQHDYDHVQDRNAMAMVSLESSSDAGVVGNWYNGFSSEFTLDLSDLNITTATERDAYIDQLEEYFMLQPTTDVDEDRRPKVYFKFLYALFGEDASLVNCKSEYITGYTTVNKIMPSGTADVKLRLGSTKFMNNAYAGQDRPNIPREICYDFAINERSGKLNADDCKNPIGEFGTTVVGLFSGDEKVEKSGFFNPSFLTGSGGLTETVESLKESLEYQLPLRITRCKAINDELSYMKLPTFHAKKGGGVRVKRLLMFDPGITTEDAMLYGSEYHYVTEEGRSSGVATNEPMAAREENALVSLLPKKRKTWVERVISGRDLDQTEGPLGENLLPGASIGYSRVVIENIHTGETGTGFEVHDFHTVKDFPFDMIYADDTQTDMKGPGVASTSLEDNKRRDWLKLPTGVFNYSVDNRWYAQGYRFIKNDMHGQKKRIASYGGTYDPDQLEASYLSSATEYEYFKPGEMIKMLQYDETNKKFVYTEDVPGKEEDVTMECKTIESKTRDFELELDIGIGLVVIPPVTVSFFVSFAVDEVEMNTHVTSKVFHYPTILKSTREYKDGLYHETENLAFNPENGQPVVTASKDVFDGIAFDGMNRHNGTYYNWNIPASWVYPELGQKAADPLVNTNQLALMAGSIESYSSNGNWLGHEYVQDDHFIHTGLNSENRKVYEWDITAAQTPVEGVVGASATTFAKNWFAQANTNGSEWASIGHDYDLGSLSGTVLTKLNDKWRARGEYRYKDDITPANQGGGNMVSGGILQDFEMFDWQNIGTDATLAAAGAPASWIHTSETKKYDPNGRALESWSLPNDMRIPSAAKYGYDGLLTSMSAQNATYEQIFFEDFEDNAQSAPVDAHTGVRCLQYEGNSGYQYIESGNNLKLTQHMMDNGAEVRVWAKFTDQEPDDELPELKAILNSTTQVPMEVKARSGEWVLYGTSIKDWTGINVNDVLTLKLSANYDQSAHDLLLDDFKFQPSDAQASCYVYDPTNFKLLASFDDQHFALLYQYNDEGKLVRKLKETERGIKTIQETQYNTPRLQQL